VRKVVLAGAILLLGTLLSLAAMGWLFVHFAKREAADQPPPSSLAGAPSPESVPEPRLQTAPALDLAKLRAHEELELGRFEWADRKAGTVRIPIERAMDLLVAKEAARAASAKGGR
jgi:hypothetical protein